MNMTNEQWFWFAFGCVVMYLASHGWSSEFSW
jgi:hypothetical protein